MRFTTLIGDDGITGLWDSIYLVTAADRSDALGQARILGKSREEIYRNAENEQVRRAFAGVITIDELGENIKSGVEVWFSPMEFTRPIPVKMDTTFFPENVQPGNAGIGIEQALG